MGMEGNILIWIVSAVLLICLVLCLIIIRLHRSGERKTEQAGREIALLRESERIFERMVPAELLRLLKIKSYAELKVGSHQYFSAVVMDVNKADFSGVVHNKEAAEVFTSINAMLGKIIPVVYGRGGLVDSFDQGGICALFPQNYEEALTAAVSVCEEINAMGDREYETVAVGLTKGSVMIGVVGHEERMTILLLSEAEEFAGFLRSIGYRYYARILATRELLEAARNKGGHFNYRILGRIHIRSTGASVEVCDIFDGDPVDIRNRKRKTRIVFEKGIELFWAGQLGEARQHFVEVLKTDAMDRAAAYYLLRCDECMNEKAQWTDYFESY